MDFGNSGSLFESDDMTIKDSESSNMKQIDKSLNKGTEAKRRNFPIGGMPDVKQQSGYGTKSRSMPTTSHHKEKVVAKSYAMSSSELDGKKVSVVDANKAVKAKVKLDDGDKVHVMSAEDLTMFKSLPFHNTDQSTSEDARFLLEIPFDEHKPKGRITEKTKKEKMASKSKKSNLINFKSLLSANMPTANDLDMDFTSNEDPNIEIDDIFTDFEKNIHNTVGVDLNNMETVGLPNEMPTENFPLYDELSQSYPPAGINGISTTRFMSFPRGNPNNIGQQMFPYSTAWPNHGSANFNEPYSMRVKQQQNSEQSVPTMPVDFTEEVAKDPNVVGYRGDDESFINDLDPQQKYKISEHIPTEAEYALVFNNEDGGAAVSTLSADSETPLFEGYAKEDGRAAVSTLSTDSETPLFEGYTKEDGGAAVSTLSTDSETPLFEGYTKEDGRPEVSTQNADLETPFFEGYSPGFDQKQNILEEDQELPESLDFSNNDDYDFPDQSHSDDIENPDENNDHPDPGESPEPSEPEADGQQGEYVDPTSSKFSSFSFDGSGLSPQMSAQYRPQDSSSSSAFSVAIPSSAFYPVNSISAPTSSALLPNVLAPDFGPDEENIDPSTPSLFRLPSPKAKGMQQVQEDIEMDKAFEGNYPMVPYAVKRPEIINMDNDISSQNLQYSSYHNKFPLHQPNMYNLPFYTIRPWSVTSLQRPSAVSSLKRLQLSSNSFVPKTTFMSSYKVPMSWYARSFADDGNSPLNLGESMFNTAMSSGEHLWRYPGYRMVKLRKTPMDTARMFDVNQVDPLHKIEGTEDSKNRLKTLVMTQPTRGQPRPVPTNSVIRLTRSWF